MQKNILAALFFMLTQVLAAQTPYMIVGTYTSNSKSEGIYVYKFNSQTGDFKELSHAKAGNPSYLAISKNQKFVYSVNESNNGKIAAFVFDKRAGKLTQINSQDNNGAAPCYVSIDQTGKWLFAGNYSSGDLTVHPINRDGSIGSIRQTIKHSGNGPNKERQMSPHVHCVYISGDNRHLYVPDLGIDKVMIYPFNSKTGTLNEAKKMYAQVQPGGGPRHITFSKNGKFAYLVEEMSGTVDVFTQQNGALTKIQESNDLTLEKPFTAWGADIHLSNDERFLYVSQRRNNTIQLYAVNKDGTIRYKNAWPSGGVMPRNFSLDPSGNFLLAANQDSDVIAIYKRNKTTGELTDTGKRINVGKPVCIKWIQ